MGKYRKRTQQRRGRKKYKIGTKIYIHAYNPYDDTIVHLCEARVIRTPRKPHLPYKLLVSAVKTPGSFDDSDVGSLLGKKMLRGPDSIFDQVPNWLDQDQQEEWIRLDENTAEHLVTKAVNNIRKERQRQQIRKR